MTNKDMVNAIADNLLQDHIELMTENAAAKQVVQAAADFFGWFNKHYPEPSRHPDHEWNKLAMALLKAQGDNNANG